jgi:hypothetical protein
MAKARTLVGLDVHAAKIVAAVLDAETGEVVDLLGFDGDWILWISRFIA